MEAYSDPTPQRIYDDIKYVVDTYGPTRNYAKIDGKWLVLVYGSGGEEAASRWRDAKTMLAADGYNLYLNGNVGEASPKTAPDPWDISWVLGLGRGPSSGALVERVHISVE